MTSARSVEERITRWFVEEAPGDLPDRVLQATFERTRVTRQERRRDERALVDRRWVVLLAAALVIVTIAAVALGGGLVLRVTTPLSEPDTLQGVLDGGVLRVAVRPDDPQTPTSGGLDGFDVDVARELARRLGVAIQLVELAPDAMFAEPGAWDIALPSTPIWSIDGDRFLAASAYYQWPHLLVVRADSGAESVTDVQGQPICAVGGDAGQTWLLGRYGPASATSPSGRPIPSSLIRRDSDAQCLETLRSGGVVAIVTSTLSPADVAVRADVRAIGGPPPEPRTALVDRSRANATDLLAAVERALGDMRTDGALARLSMARFGGDLTRP